MITLLTNAKTGQTASSSSLDGREALQNKPKPGANEPRVAEGRLSSLFSPRLSLAALLVARALDYQQAFLR